MACGVWRGGGGDSPSPWEDAQCFVPDRSDDCAAMTFLIDSCDENLCLTWENNESGEETSTRDVSGMAGPGIGSAIATAFTSFGMESWRTQSPVV